MLPRVPRALLSLSPLPLFFSTSKKPPLSSPFPPSEKPSNKVSQHLQKNIPSGKMPQGKGSEGKGSEENVSERDGTGPQVIEISKQQYQDMLQFMTDVRLSLQDAQVQGQQDKVAEIGRKYFDTLEQRLSFELLKLSSPGQFLKYFQQYQKSDNVSIKVMIVVMYSMISSNQFEGITGKMAQKYIEDILPHLSKLNETQLKKFLEMYLQYVKTSGLSAVRLKLSTDNIPLLSSSKISTQLLTLILQFVHECEKNDQTISECIQKVLNYYSIDDNSSNESELVEKQIDVQPGAYLKQLAYIASQGIIVRDQRWLEKFIVAVEALDIDGQSYESNEKKSWVIESYKVIIITLSTHPQKLCKTLLHRLQTHLLPTLPPLLPLSPPLLSCTLLCLQSPLSPSLTLLLTNVSHNIIQLLCEECPMLGEEEYLTCWTCAMSLYKLTSKDIFPQKTLINFVQAFINKGKTITNLEDKNYEQFQSTLFQALVAYRIVLPPGFQVKGEQFCNLNVEISGNCDKNDTSVISESVVPRKKLRQLLQAYQSTITNISRTTPIESPEDPLIHNIIMVSLIASAYSYKGTPLVSVVWGHEMRKILKEVAIHHEKYGDKVKKIIEQFQ